MAVLPSEQVNKMIVIFDKKKVEQVSKE